MFPLVGKVITDQVGNDIDLRDDVSDGQDPIKCVTPELTELLRLSQKIPLLLIKFGIRKNSSLS